MFNKPNLFPKFAESASQRAASNRPGVPVTPASASSGTSSMSEPVPAVQSATVPVGSAAFEASGQGQTSGSRLIVGPDVKLKGAEILDCDTLVVEGRVEATIDSRVIRIAEDGAYEGTVGIDVAEIHGRFEGELTARQQLIIHATGRVSGKIRYGKILIEEGGEISGDVQSLAKVVGKEGLRAIDKHAAELKPLAAVAG